MRLGAEGVRVAFVGATGSFVVFVSFVVFIESTPRTHEYVFFITTVSRLSLSYSSVRYLLPWYVFKASSPCASARGVDSNNHITIEL